MQIEFSGVSEHLMRSTVPKEMLSLSVLPDGRTKCRINSSSLSIIQECGRKAQLSLDRNLRSNLESPATMFGSAIHKGLEVFYCGEVEDRVMPKGFRSNAEIMAYGTIPEEEDYLVYRAIRAFVESAQDLCHLPDEDKRSVSTGVWLLAQYLETYIDDPYVVIRDESGPFVERRGEAVLFEDDSLVIEYFGTVDVGLVNRHNGITLICDHKTSSVVGNQFFNRLKPNHQYTGYLYLAQEAFGIDTDKFLVNCLEVKARPKTARGKGPSFPRQVTTRSEEDVQEFKDAVIDAVRNYLRWNKTGVWPMGHVSACAAYAGCQFLDICSSPKCVRENIINTKYLEAK
jgi:hypothetical protein